jgi:hypothetical protein
MSIQHPDSGNNSTTQLDAAGNAIGFDKSISLVISLESTSDLIWYLDADVDGFATPNTISSPTNPGAGYTTTILPNTDCDDNDASINPDTIWYLDADNDGFTHPTTVKGCLNPGTGYAIAVLQTTDSDGFADSIIVENGQRLGTRSTKAVLPATDCNDSDASVTVETLWYLDLNRDGLADEAPVFSCDRPGAEYVQDELPLRSELTKDGPIFYPNPTENEVTILLEKTYEKLLVEVYTLDRERVLQKAMNNTDQISFELKNQQAGVYFLQIIYDGKRIGFYKVIRL